MQDEVNQEESEQDVVDGITLETNSTDNTMHIEKSCYGDWHFLHYCPLNAITEYLFFL